MVFDDGGLKPVSGPIVCFEAAASDDHGDHAPIVIKKTIVPSCCLCSRTIMREVSQHTNADNNAVNSKDYWSQ